MDASIDEAYFEWLYKLTEAPSHKNPARSYFLLLGQLYTKAFRWTIHNDDNREMDGLELRDKFLDAFPEYTPSQDWMELDCSFLEMLIALSERVAFDSYGRPAEWFWKMISNIGLRDYRDEVFDDNFGEEVDEVLERVLSRSYDSNGHGGLFPLEDPEGRDQRRIELRYQMAAYVLEGEYVDNGP